MSTIKVNKIENTSTTNGGVSIDNDGHVTIDGQQLPTAGPLSNRNMVINGDMTIAQRGFSITYDTTTTAGAFASDRFKAAGSSTQLIGTLERAYDAATGVPDLPFSLKWTTNTAESAVDAGDLLYIAQYIEGFNAQSPKFGTSAAQQTTLSFWVKCSIAGTYAVSIYRGTTARNIVTTYTVNSTSTWEYKTVTFPADTTGVVTPNTSEGVRLNWHLMAGSNYTGTDASTWGAYSSSRWAGSGVINNSVPTTLNATWEITGVQYEVGSKSTPFEHRSYSSELQRCLRYYFKPDCEGTAKQKMMGMSYGTNTYYIPFELPVPMRVGPTVNVEGGGSWRSRTDNINDFDVTWTTHGPATPTNVMLQTSGGSIPNGTTFWFETHDSTGCNLEFSAEL